MSSQSSYFGGCFGQGSVTTGDGAEIPPVCVNENVNVGVGVGPASQQYERWRDEFNVVFRQTTGLKLAPAQKSHCAVIQSEFDEKYSKHQLSEEYLAHTIRQLRNIARSSSQVLPPPGGASSIKVVGVHNPASGSCIRAEQTLEVGTSYPDLIGGMTWKCRCGEEFFATSFQFTNCKFDLHWGYRGPKQTFQPARGNFGEFQIAEKTLTIDLPNGGHVNRLRLDTDEIAADRPSAFGSSWP